MKTKIHAVLTLFLAALLGMTWVQLKRAENKVAVIQDSFDRSESANRINREKLSQLESDRARQDRLNGEIYSLRAKAQEFQRMKKEVAARKSEISKPVTSDAAPGLSIDNKLQVENWVLKAYVRTQTAAYAALYGSLVKTNVYPSQLMSPEIAEAIEQQLNFPEYIARMRAGATDAELGRDYGYAPQHPEMQRLMREAGIKERLIEIKFPPNE